MCRFAFVVLLFAIPAFADWKPAPVPISTRWAKEVSPDKVLPEYPRPQMVRKDWKNLNGLWDYAITAKDAPQPSKWNGQILVPFCIESSLSGVGKHPDEKQALWYHRTFQSTDLQGGRLLLHFGAVDWHCKATVNGKPVGEHKGGFDPFTFDITDAVKTGDNELVVWVWDPTDKGSQPVGKQISNPHGIWYTPVTGIWQTVWLERVPAAYIESLRAIPDVDTSSVRFVARCRNTKKGDVISFNVRTGDHSWSSVMTRVFDNGIAEATIKVTAPKLWAPDAPYLYDTRTWLWREDKDTPIDEVLSYCAMRKISIGKDDKGVMRLLLNNKPLFQYGPLDQGWWPDGLYTAPTEEAMVYDLKVLKDLGMNMLRKHIKVEPSRLYYQCDKLGLLVWQDMPSCINRTKKHFIPPNAAKDAEFDKEEQEVYNRELKAMIDHLSFFPCIVGWVPFNEGWGQHDTNEVLKWTMKYDPTRLVDGPSGWQDRGVGHMKDLHQYPGPGMFPVLPDRVSVLGEFGGLGLPLKGHLWKDRDNWGYQNFKTIEELRDNYHRLMLQLHPLIGKGLAAAVYTQTTDVEIEVNGLMTYDREVIKLDPKETARWHKALYGPPPEIRTLVETSEKAPQAWRYTIEKPAAGWEKADFDAATWKEGKGGFGTAMTPGTFIGTEWKTGDIWIRRQAELTELPKGDVLLRIHHDEDAEIYINGVLAGKVGGFVTDYSFVPLTVEGRKAFKVGKNTIAVHCHQTGGGQYIDVGLVEMVQAK
jgi:Glycosyl hydrolases family 2, sugar binding domain/Glycosyl hydrolases family 2, TIM barrel domain/Glycosyl hydrolases family 2